MLSARRAYHRRRAGRNGTPNRGAAARAAHPRPIQCPHRHPRADYESGRGPRAAEPRRHSSGQLDSRPRGGILRHGDLVNVDKRALRIAVVAVAAAVALGYWAGDSAGPGAGVLAAMAGLISAAVLQVALDQQGSANKERAR